MTVPEEIKALETQLSLAYAAGAPDSTPDRQAGIILEILTRYARIRSMEGQPYAERLLLLADEMGSIHYRAWAIYHQAIVARYGGDYVAALSLSRQAHELFGEDDDQMGMARCHTNTGNIYLSMANYAEALKNHLQALKIREGAGDKGGIAVSYTNIAIICFGQGNYEGALENNLLALKIMEETGNRQGMANAYTNIGNVHYIQGRYDEAMKNYLLCLQIEQETGNEHGIATAQANIGGIHRSTGNYEEALRNYLPARQRYEELGDKQGNALQLNNIGVVYAAQGDHERALACHLQALEISEEIGSKEEARGTCLNLSNIYRVLDDHRNALKYFDRYHALDKEMLGQQAQRQMIQLNFQHDMELKEKESQLLREKNEAIHVYTQKLEMSNNELKQFADVASHDLREPLRMVSSYMNLLSQSLGEQANPAQRQFIWFAEDGARRMENLIHDLLRLAKVDADPRIEKVPLMDVIEEVKSNIGVLLNEKKAKVIATAVPTIMADRTQVIQLFQNIISNGIKYNESDQPAINIGCENRGADIMLTIADNGIGIPAEYREKAFQIFRRLPTAKQYAGSGIGLAICKKIVDGLGGNIAIDDNPGGGTVFRISLPAAVLETQ